MNQSTALPNAWIERLFARMAAMYGSRFADMWQGTNQVEVKATWAEALGKFTAEELKNALDVCLSSFEYPPTLPQFRNVCKAQVKPSSLMLSGPRTPMPEKVREQLAEFRRKHSAKLVDRPYIDYEESGQA